jgi:hypothetical protein
MASNMPGRIAPEPHGSKPHRAKPMTNRYEEFRIRILERAATATQSKPYISVVTQALANQHGIPHSHVREELLRLARAECIALSAWDGERERFYDDWVDADSLFSNATDRGHVRIRLLTAGAESLSKASNLQ